MERLIEIVKKGLDHSIAQAFLIFSAIFVVLATIQAPNYISLALFTLFYAFINFKIESLRKHESLGVYAMGKRGQIITFTLILIFLLIWWITGAWAILQRASWQNWYDLIPPSWPSISSYALIISLFLITTWIIWFFSKLPKDTKPTRSEIESKESYELDVKVNDFSLLLRKSKRPDPDA